ncbi:MAG: M16 family metallopeptidase [Paracoccaceae bacterium]
MTVRVDTLPNGFRVATEHMPGLASASVGVWVDAGTRDETALENGIAHFLEHIAFKGTSWRSALQIAEEIENVGGYLNAYTSRERTAYYARVLSGDVPLAMDILTDILRDPQMAEPEIEMERGVILQEIGQSLDTPDDIIFDWLQETAFPDQPMGRAILGTPGHVRGFQRDDLQSFIGTHYTPERLVLSAAGGVDHDEIMKLAERGFGDMLAGQAPTKAIAAYRGGERREVKSLEQAHFTMALEAPGYRDETYYAAQIAAMALGGGMSSRLFQEAREKRGLCYTIFSQIAAWNETGLLMIYAGTGADEVRGLVDLTIDELRRAVEDLSEVEINRARAQAKAGLVMGLESPSSRAERMASLLSIWGELIPLEDVVARLDAVDAAAARRALLKMLESTPSLALYGPVSDARSAAELAERLAA